MRMCETISWNPFFVQKKRKDQIYDYFDIPISADNIQDGFQPFFKPQKNGKFM